MLGTRYANGHLSDDRGSVETAAFLVFICVNRRDKDRCAGLCIQTLGKTTRASPLAVIGQSPIERNNPRTDLDRSRCAQSVELFFGKARVTSIDIGECEEAGYRPGCFGIRCEESLPGCRSRFDCLLEADDPELPKNVVMPLVDREQRAVAIRALVQCPDCNAPSRDRERGSHDQGYESRFIAFASPNDRQPFAWHDQFRADKRAGDEAVQLFQQHCIFAESQKLLLKLSELARLFGHEVSSSKEAFDQS